MSERLPTILLHLLLALEICAAGCEDDSQVDACPGPYASAAPVAGLNVDFESAGQMREFWLALPPDTFEGPRPIFFGFNGTGGDGESFFDSVELADFVDRGFIVAAPSSNDNGEIWPVWDAMRQPEDLDEPNPDLDYFDDLLQCLSGHLNIDQDRIYAGGHSAGGIFMNHLLQRRSDVLAGGIVASGIFSLTSPADPEPLDETFVLVTWGGPDDTHSGGEGSTSVSEINFAEQASIASIYYDEQANVGQVNCSADIGHEWLTPLNEWMLDRLLEHPRGVPGSEGLEIPATGVEGYTCTTEPFVYVPEIQVECPTSETPGCSEFCQLTADCGVENSTVGPVLEAELTILGFSGDRNAECSGCVSNCETTATEADAPILECLSAAQESAECTGGIEGADPLVNGINDCCDGQLDSPYCQFICTTIAQNLLALVFFPTCTDYQ